jgi:hypothetical protein
LSTRCQYELGRANTPLKAARSRLGIDHTSSTPVSDSGALPPQSLLTHWRRARFRIWSDLDRGPCPDHPFFAARRHPAAAPFCRPPPSHHAHPRRHLLDGLVDHPTPLPRRSGGGLRTACHRDRPGSRFPCARSRPGYNRSRIFAAFSKALGSISPYGSGERERIT